MFWIYGGYREMSFDARSRWEAGSGAVFDLASNTRRPDGWTSADAAGLAILPGAAHGLVIADETQIYGLIVADNGSDMYVTGSMDGRWNNAELNPAFAALTAADFEVIRLGWR
jgi:hypothetical protein